MTDQEPNKEADKTHYKLTMMKATNIAFEFGFMIALPLIGFGYLGKYLDAKWGTNFLMLVGIILALVSSSVWFFKRVRAIAKDLNNMQK
jgi:hypothetical protein